MKKLSVWDGVALLSIAAAMIATWTVFDRLPDPLPTHFGLDGKPNGWMPRVYGAWVIPAVAVVLWLVTRLLPFVLPKSDKPRLADGSLPFVAMLTTVFVSAVHVVVLYVALDPSSRGSAEGGTRDVTQLIFALMAIFFVALGLVMPRLRRNRVVGVRTPWTLTSEENWARTHRVAGYSMVGGGLLGGLCAMIGGAVGSLTALACFLAAGIIPAVWSFLYARRQDPN